MNTYRTPSPPLPEKKEKKVFMPDEVKIGLVVGTVVVSLFGSLIYGTYHDSRARNMHYEHDLFIRRQEICIAKDGWYEASENYHGLLACHRLDDHSLFYVVEDTGLELVPVENQ